MPDIFIEATEPPKKRPGRHGRKGGKPRPAPETEIEASIREHGYVLRGNKWMDIEWVDSEVEKLQEAYTTLGRWSEVHDIFDYCDDDGQYHKRYVTLGKEREDFAELFTQAGKLTEHFAHPEQDAWILATAILREPLFFSSSRRFFPRVNDHHPGDLTPEIIKELTHEYHALPIYEKMMESAKASLPAGLIPEDLISAGCRNQSDAKFFIDLTALLHKEFNLCDESRMINDLVVENVTNTVRDIMRQRRDATIPEIREEIKECAAALQDYPDYAGITPVLDLAQAGCRNAHDVKRVMELMEACKSDNRFKDRSLTPCRRLFTNLHSLAQDMPETPVNYILEAAKTFNYLPAYENNNRSFDSKLTWKTSSATWRNIAQTHPDLEPWQRLVIGDVIAKTGWEQAEIYEKAGNVLPGHGGYNQFPQQEDFSAALTDAQHNVAQKTRKQVLAKLPAILAKDKKQRGWPR